MTWTHDNVAIVMPVLNRPHLLSHVERNLKPWLDQGVQWWVLPSGSGPDTFSWLADHPAAQVLKSDGISWPAKLNRAYHWSWAVNGGHPRYLFCCADDVYFHDGWLDQIMKVMETPDVHVVGALDNLNNAVMAGQHATHFMVDTRYLAEQGGVPDAGPGSFINEKYRHNFSDNEFIGTARKRGVFAMSDAVVEHFHHLNGTAPYDETYRIGDESMQADGELAGKRQHLWA